MVKMSLDYSFNKDVTLVETKSPGILKKFRIEHATITPVTDKVHKIEVARHAYALKRTKSNLLENKVWHSLINHSMPAMVPILKTNGQVAVLDDEHTAYYLIPWISSYNGNLKLVECFAQLASFHHATKQEVSIYKNEWERKLTELEARGRDLEREINHVLLSCENEHYMSPFSLQFCTNFTRTMHLIQMFQRLIRTLKRELDNNQTHSYCINHGHLKRPHMLWDNKLCLINYENAIVRNPIYDLFDFFTDEMSSYANGFDFFTYEKSLQAYLKVYQLSRLEVLYLYILLMDPSDYMEEASLYRLQKTKKPMTERIILQAARFRRMQLGLYLFNREEKRIKEKAKEVKNAVETDQTS